VEQHGEDSSMTVQKLQWHKPQINFDFGIYVPPRKNTWPTFFKKIGEHFKAHQTFPIVYPGFEIIKTSIFKNRVVSRERMQEIRQRRRTKKDKRDPIEFRQIPLPGSVITKLESGLKIKRADDKPITDREWDKLVDEVIASIVVKSVLQK
jgi:hypothetical protein